MFNIQDTTTLYNQYHSRYVMVDLLTQLYLQNHAHPGNLNHGWMQALNKTNGSNVDVGWCVLELGLPVTDVSSQTFTHCHNRLMCGAKRLHGIPKLLMEIIINPEIAENSYQSYSSQVSSLSPSWLLWSHWFGSHFWHLLHWLTLSVPKSPYEFLKSIQWNKSYITLKFDLKPCYPAIGLLNKSKSNIWTLGMVQARIISNGIVSQDICQYFISKYPKLTWQSKN